MPGYRGACLLSKRGVRIAPKPSNAAQQEVLYELGDMRYRMGGFEPLVSIL